jgi:hypothetical protein
LATRIVFLPTEPGEDALFREILVNFEWVPGMAISQAKKSVRNLHASASKNHGLSRVLEISTRSEEVLGVSLSAFNLKVDTGKQIVSVETAYQSSKCFERGGPYLDLLNVNSTDAKKDSRLKSSGSLIGFAYGGFDWPIKLAPNFYDFLYISALLQFRNRKELANYEAFTDIAFGQISLEYKAGKSYNCQARSTAIFISLLHRYPEESILENLRVLCNKNEGIHEQMGLF